MVEKIICLRALKWFCFVSKAFKELGKERERYLENMEQLKKRLIDAGLYGPNIVRDPQHLTANGVAWCKRTGSALGAFVSLISEIEEEIEGSYVVQLYQSNATTVLQKLNNLKRNFEGINLTSKTDKELCLLAEIKQN
ncbi:MAG: hypothetical protein HWD59_09145 [Coxiellaceae bacterium]|nr:MAG: hypothetical protein HWD59_09145 [Coxiellaceae bacterium]